MPLTPQQIVVLDKPIHASRVAKRNQGGKQLSYLESFDVRAHLIRMFDLCNFDIELLDQYLVGVRQYNTQDDKPMVEPMWFAKVQVTIRDTEGTTLAVYSDAAVGSNASPEYLLAEAHDNAMKTAASDALKRCCINLGNQFGLSLYDQGSTRDVIRGVVPRPKVLSTGPDEGLTDEQKANLEHSLGATEVTDTQSVTEEQAGMPSQQEVGA